MKLQPLLASVLMVVFVLAGALDVAGQEKPGKGGRGKALPGKELPHPPAVGDEAPDFKLKNLEGQSISLNELTKDHTVLLLVLRGWPGYQCPICSRQMGEFLQQKEEFAKRGVEVVMIYPGPSDLLAEHAKEFRGNTRLPENYHYVMDPDYVFTNAWGLRWEAERETAYPSTFLVGQDGKIKFGETSTTHGGRTGAATVLKELDKLSEK